MEIIDHSALNYFRKKREELRSELIKQKIVTKEELWEDIKKCPSNSFSSKKLNQKGKCEIQPIVILVLREQK
jgi:hypothetical protein